MLTCPYNFTAFRQRLAAQGVYLDREPSDFPVSSDILGLTSDALGFYGCGFALNELRRVAKERLGRDYAIMALREPGTGMRLGYKIHTVNQTDADAVRDRVQCIVDRARARAAQ